MVERALPPETVDMLAVRRIASRVNLIDVRLDKMTAEVLGQVGEELTAGYSASYAALPQVGATLPIECHFEFSVVSGRVDVIEAAFTFRLLYEVEGDGPIADDDLTHFASANGAYHTWPFVRETLYSLTGRMGLPPYVLPVLSFAPPRPKAPATEAEDPTTSGGASEPEQPS